MPQPPNNPLRSQSVPDIGESAQSGLDLSSHARAVVIGGGIMGCSTAYHLALLGWKDVVLVERHKLTSGSTFHAAGLVGQLRADPNLIRIQKDSIALYNRLEAETGLASGWHGTGGMRIACTEDRMTEFRRQATMATSYGVELHLLSRREILDRWPVMDASDVIGGVWLPVDGHASPSDITMAIAKGARMRGVRIIEDCPVTGITITEQRATGVETPYGTITAEVVVNCGGQWAREIGLLAGVHVPMVSILHQYIITDGIDGVTPSTPVLRDPDHRTYYKEEVGGLAIGGYPANPVSWAEDRIPDEFNFTLLTPDWDHFQPLTDAMLKRVPVLKETGIKTLINGPCSFTSDGNYILGEAPELRQFYVGCAFNSYGIGAGGGAGKALAEWIVGGEPPMDLWPVDIRRFGQIHRSLDWVRRRSLELCGMHYTQHYPHEEYRSGREQRLSPLYQELKDSRACFGEKSGWERANWFARNDMAPHDDHTFGRPNWFDAVGEEHRAARETAALFDQSSFSKLLVVGPDAAQALSWICANSVDRPVGRTTYTHLLNRHGGIEADVTANRLSRDRFLIVAGTSFGRYTQGWIERNLPVGSRVTVVDVTSAYATLSLMGPRSRDILGAVTTADLSSTAFPFASCREITIGGAPVIAVRITYVGELGWELYIPTEHALSVYRRLIAAGAGHGMLNAGYRAIESLRLEKGYLAWGKDIGPDDTPFEAGTGWSVKLRHNVPFLGREALVEKAVQPLTRRFTCFTVTDPDAILLGQETIYRDGERIGYLSSAGWGYTVERNIGYGYVTYAGGVTDNYLRDGTYELEVATQRVPCQVALDRLYDPANARVKA